MSSSANAVRPYLYFPLVTGCSSNFSSSYGIRTLTNPPVLLGPLNTVQNAYTAIANTMYFPSTTNIITQGLAQDTSGSGVLNILGGPFTVSLLIRMDVATHEIAAVTLLGANPGAICFTIRLYWGNIVFLWAGACRGLGP